MCACRFLDLIGSCWKNTLLKQRTSERLKDVCYVYKFVSRPFLGGVAFYSFGLFDHKSGITPSARRLLTWCWIVFVNLQTIVRVDSCKQRSVFVLVSNYKTFFLMLMVCLDDVE